MIRGAPVFFLTLGVAATGIVSSQLGCEKDVVLPSVVVPAVCGNGIPEQGEDCDNTSLGCVGCRVAPEWTCPNNVCSVDCTSDPGVVPSGLSCARTASCNMAGYWAVRETDYTAPAGLSVPSKSTQWYLYHLTQTGSRYSIDTALDCGIHVTGAADVDYTPNTQQFLMYRSGIDEGEHAPRQGTAESTPDGCNVSLDRFFFIRGALTSYLPSHFDNDASLPPAASLPWLDAPPLPAQPPGQDLAYDTHFPRGAVNTDGVGDGGVIYPGGASQISGDVNGVRHSAQRDYKGYAATAPIPPGSLSFSFPGNYSLQESVLSVTDCLDKGSTIICELLTTVAYPAPDYPPSVTFSFIGSDLNSARTASVVVGVPKKVYASDLATCANIRLILPHDGSIHDGSAPPDASAR